VKMLHDDELIARGRASLDAQIADAVEGLAFVEARRARNKRRFRLLIGLVAVNYAVTIAILIKLFHQGETMALQLGALRDALLEAGASAEKAGKAAEELAAYDNQIAEIRATQRLHTWMLTVLLGAAAAILLPKLIQFLQPVFH